MLNGDSLLSTFLEFVEKERPERFYPLKYAGREDGMKTNWVPDFSWKIIIAKEACYGAYDAVFYREKKGWVREIIPIEVKADTDILDNRLRAQLWVHIKNFGKSMLVLGKEQAFKLKKLKLHKMLPTEIWAYNGVGFTQVTEPISKFHNEGYSNLSQRAIEKAFGIHEPKKLRVMQKKLRKIRGIIALIEANQWRFAEENKFTSEQSKLAFDLLGFTPAPEVCSSPPEKDITSVATTGFSTKTIQKTLLTNSTFPIHS